MAKLTSIIVVKDSPPFLLKTIASVDDLVQEIIIVDIGIDPNLKDILVRNKKIKLVEIKEAVPYVELIREKTKSFANSDYLIFLDPDEVIPPALKQIIEKKTEFYDYLSMPRKNIIFGRWIKHCRWWPDYQTRVFKKDKVIWPKIIHRQPKVSGTGFRVEPKEELALIHHNYRDLDEYLDKAKRYAKYEAKEFILEKKLLTFGETVRRAINELVSRYFAAEGYKDGMQGFVLSCFQMIYYFLVYFYYLEMMKFKDDKTIKPELFFRQGLKETLYWKKKR
ncbi:hypothetical protein COS50_00915, partial [Candidatus Roizmanbacteria bacterium CG03_land_8_20_14_0_80_35_26]